MPFRTADLEVDNAELHPRRLHVLFDRLPALVAYWDRDCRNLIANAAYVEYFGRSPEEILGVHISEVLGAEVYAKNLPFITGVLRGEEQLFERTLVDVTGRVRHTQASYVPDVVDGETHGFFVLVTDVTPRVEAQRAMDEAQRIAQLGSWSLVVNSGVLTWSDELYEIFGLDPATFVPTVEDVLGRVDPRDLESVTRQLDRARETGEPYDMVYRIRRADGRLCEVHSQVRSHQGPDGVVVRLTGTLQDVTASNAAARELSRVNGELRKVNQLNADVLAMLGHDVRAPLSVILGYLEELTLGWEESSEEERRGHIGRATKAARRMRDLIDDILAMATVDAGQIVPQAVAMCAVEQVRAAVEVVADGLDIEVHSEDFPEAFADPFHVRQIVSNLITNAIRYGAPPIDVQVARGEGETVTISVSDRGDGVPEDQVVSLFERFAGNRVGSSVVRAGTSTGFGLYIADGLATANNGGLEYIAHQTGACFRLTLPAVKAHD